MIDVLKRLAELDADNPNVVDPSLGVVKPEKVLNAVKENSQINETDPDEREIPGAEDEPPYNLSKRKYDDAMMVGKPTPGGLKDPDKNVDECGGDMMPSASQPHTPASISMTAASGEELGSMLKDIMSLAGLQKSEPVGHEEPAVAIGVAEPEAGPEVEPVGGPEDEKHAPSIMRSMMDKLHPDSDEADEGWKGELAGGAAGALGGAALGAASPVPFGAEIGAALGGKAGSMVGDKLGGKDEEKTDEMYDNSPEEQVFGHQKMITRGSAPAGEFGAAAGHGLANAPKAFAPTFESLMSEYKEFLNEANLEESKKKWVAKAVKGIKKGALRKQERKKKGEKFGKGELKGLAAHGTPKEKKRAQFALNISKK